MSSGDFEYIIYTREDGIATITLNHPQTLNAINPKMTEEWIAAINDAKYDNDVKVLVVTGTGRGFCSGLNPRFLDARAKGDQPIWPGLNKFIVSEMGIPRTLSTFYKPYIGAINGPAAGAGMDMANLCDIRIASEKAKFAMSYVRMALTPADGGVKLLPQIVGVDKACELIWTGRSIDAEEALRLGYVSKVVPHEQLMSATKELAQQLAKGPPLAIQISKRLIYQCLTTTLDRALDLAESAMLIVRNTEDAKEGIRSWVDKREPKFTGR